MRIGLYWLLAVALPLLLTGCASAPSTANDTITVFAASSLTDAFTEIASVFEAQHSDVEVLLNFAGSSQLAAQLREGVPADVFAPANAVSMEIALEAGRAERNAVQTFATNRLTLIVPTDNPLSIQALDDVTQPGTQLILAAPNVPIREYTDALIALQPTALATGIYENLVSEEENVRQVVAKIALGEADAGIVYATDITPDVAPRVQAIEIPQASRIVATYPIVPLLDAPQHDLAQRFVEFVLNAEGQAILADWGFEPAPNP